MSKRFLKPQPFRRVFAIYQVPLGRIGMENISLQSTVVVMVQRRREERDSLHGGAKKIACHYSTSPDIAESSRYIRSFPQKRCLRPEWRRIGLLGRQQPTKKSHEPSFGGTRKTAVSSETTSSKSRVAATTCSHIMPWTAGEL